MPPAAPPSCSSSSTRAIARPIFRHKRLVELLGEAPSDRGRHRFLDLLSAHPDPTPDAAAALARVGATMHYAKLDRLEPDDAALIDRIYAIAAAAHGSPVASAIGVLRRRLAAERTDP